MKECIEKEAILLAIEQSDPDVMADYGENYGTECGFSRSKLFEIIQRIHSVDVVKVRHGRWVDENKNPIPWDEYNSKCPSHSAYCSECGEWLTASDEYPVTGLYCPNCGALMDGKED